MRELNANEVETVAGGVAVAAVLLAVRIGYGVYRLTRATSLASHLARGGALGYGTYRGLRQIQE